MKKIEIKRIITGLMTAAMLVAVTCSAGNGLSKVDAASKDEIAAALGEYKNILANETGTERYGLGSFSIADLNSDGIPELIYDENGTPVSGDDFYTYSNGKTVKLDSSGMDIERYGSFMVSAERKTFCFFRGGPATDEGMPYDYIEYEIKGSAIVVKNSYFGLKKTEGTWTCRDKSGSISYEDFKKITDTFTSIKIYQNNESNRVVQCNPDNWPDSDTYTWKSDANGWWVVDPSGNYPASEWLKIDGKWYYFCADGYMDYSEYRDGCWLGADGAWNEAYSGGHWEQDSTGWWYADNSGWYPANQYLWIDGTNYWFNSSGYMR